MSGESERIQFESQRNAREYDLRRKLHYRRSLFVNCWHVNRDESAAMWAQYAMGGQGVAITSSYNRIIDALTLAPQELFAGVVKYLDSNSEPVQDWLFPFSKRTSFTHERELRLLYWDETIKSKLQPLANKLAIHMMDHLYKRIDAINGDLVENDVKNIAYDSGIYIPINLDLLINEVYVAPSAPVWFLEVVESVCRKYALNRVPRRSDLLSAPIV